MTTKTDITLPPLPDMSSGALKAAFEEYARAAVEADRKQRHLKEESQLEREWVHLRAMQAQYEADRQDRMPSDAEILACLRPLYSNDVAAAMGAEDDLRTARLLLSHFGSGQPAASAEPAVWVAADTLNFPHPKCISSLAYMSQIDQDRGREYVPLAIINHHAVPVAQEPVARANIYMHKGRRQFLLTELGTKAAGDLGVGAHDLFAAPVAAQDREDAERYAYLRDTPRSEWPESLRSAVDLQQNAILDREVDAARAAKGE